MTDFATHKRLKPSAAERRAKAPRRSATKFTGALVAFSLGIATFSAAPARADNTDLGLALGGLLTLFVVGKALDNSSDNKASEKRADDRKANDRKVSITVHKQPSVKPHSRYQPKPQIKKHPSTPKTARVQNTFKIPSHCVVTGHDRHHRLKTVALENCVVKSRSSARALPQACEIRVNTKRGRTYAHEIGCLNNFGYRVTRS